MSELINPSGRRLQVPQAERFANQAAPASTRPFNREAIDKHSGGQAFDSLFLNDGHQILVVAQQNLAAKGFKEGDQVKLDGQSLSVFRVNDNPDTWLGQAQLQWAFFKLGLLSNLDKLRGGTGGF